MGDNLVSTRSSGSYSADPMGDRSNRYEACIRWLARSRHTRSILCGLASSPTTLIVFRAIQGLGGGLMVPVGQTILSRRGLGVGCVGTPLMAAGYSALNRSEMPTETTLSNISQRPGQADGIAVIALVLQRAFVADLPRGHSSLDSIPTSSAGRDALGAELSHAFSTTSWALTAAFALSLVAALSFQRARDFEPLDAGEEVVVVEGVGAGSAPGIEADS
jgi:MFS family permease